MATTETKFLAGWYRISGDEHFGNVRRDRAHPGKWVADLRNAAGDLIQFAGIWNTKREAADEVTHLIRRRERAA